MHFGAIPPNWRASNEIGAKSFRLYYGHPWVAGKHVVRAMQRTQLSTKNAKNDLNPTCFLKRNYYFETVGVCRNHFFVTCPCKYITMSIWLLVGGFETIYFLIVQADGRPN
jgi:hypothetical protein